MAKRGGGQDSAGQLEHFGKRIFRMQFVLSRPANHSVNRNLRSDRGNEQGVAVLQTMQIGAHAVQEQIVGVHFLDKLFAAKMLEGAQRALCRYATSGEQGVDGS